jgi:isopenicillin-N epimerase
VTTAFTTTSLSTPASGFVLDPQIVYLNHGSFGACPRPVLDAQTRLRDELEREPTAFLARSLEGRLDVARAALAALLDGEPRQLAFVSNATAGVNTVLASLEFEPGDELLMTDHTYNACRNALQLTAQRHAARVVTAKVPFPLQHEDQVLEAVLQAVTPRTRLALIDHVTSATGLVLPVARLVRELQARGVRVLIDGAHAPGLLPFSLRTLGADYYAGNCHKWLCTPKGSAFVYVAAEHADSVRPLVISHGAITTRSDRPRLWLEHDWMGSVDPTPWLCIPDAIGFLGSLYPDGLAGLQARNRALVLHARDVLCEALGCAPPAPDSMIAALLALPMPLAGREPPAGAFADPLQARLFDLHQIEALVPYFPAPPTRLLRVCAQAYNHAAQYAQLAAVLRQELAAGH